MLIGRTVLREVGRNFLASLTATTSVAFFILSISFLQRTPGVGMGFLVQVFPLFIPLALQFTVPLAVLTSVVMTFGRMAGDGELTALSAAGVSPLAVMRPVLAGAALIALSALLLTDALAPAAAERLREAKRGFIHQLQTSFRSGLSDLDLGHGRISFESFDDDEFKDVCLEWEDQDKLQLYRAQHGSIAVTQDERVVLTLHNARGVFPYETSRGQWQGKLETITWEIPLGEITGTTMPRSRGSAQAWELAYTSAGSWERRRDVRITAAGALEELARRSALAGSAFFFALIGIPLGILSARSGRVTAFLTASAPVLLLYFPLMIGTSSLARGGKLPAYEALWAGNLLLLLVGSFLLKRVVQR